MVLESTDSRSYRTIIWAILTASDKINFFKRNYGGKILNFFFSNLNKKKLKKKKKIQLKKFELKKFELKKFELKKNLNYKI